MGKIWVISFITKKMTHMVGFGGYLQKHSEAFAKNVWIEPAC